MFVSEKAVTLFRALDDQVNPPPSQRFGWYVSGNWGFTLFSAFYPPNMDKRVRLGAGAAHCSSATSLHPGGINALMGDGSVRFITETIQTWPSDPIKGRPVGIKPHKYGWWLNPPPSGVWQALSTRNGGEKVDAETF
jgi:prepilin-type processing-associated H-X9-DG protein